MLVFRPVTYCKVLILAAGIFTASLAETPLSPPPGWVEAEGPPDYRRRTLADLKIERQINPGIYLARVHVRSREVKWKRLWIPQPKAEPLPADFLVYLTLRGPVLHDGCTVHATITGRAVPRALSGGFGAYVQRLGASSTLWLSSKHHVQSIDCAQASLRDEVRIWIERTIENRITNDTAKDAAAGFVLGSAGYMDRGFKRRAAELGILHVFAASGMHLAILYGLLFLPASLVLGKRHPLAASFPLPICVFYVWLLGFPVSLSRALVFVTLAALSCIFHRRLTAGSLLLNSALVLLVWMPREFLTLASALSFAAVGGIILCAPVLAGLFSLKNPALRFLWAQILVTTGAALGTTPLLVAAFGGHAYASAAVNLLAIPLSDLVLPLLFASLALEAVLPGNAGFLWAACDRLMTLFCDATVAASRVSGYVTVPAFSLPTTASLCLLGLIVYCALASARDSELCGRSLARMRTAIVILTVVLGPVGAGLACAAGYLPDSAASVAAFVGKPDSRFSQERSDFSVPTEANSIGNSDEIQNHRHTGLHRSGSTAQPGPELSH